MSISWKIHSFASISARDYPTVKILDHPYIWGGVQFCLNVSEKPYSDELASAMAAHGIEWAFCPVSEDDGTDWTKAIAQGMRALQEAYYAGKKIIVHCDCGNNRSRTFVEALYFILTGEEFQDEYKGAFNHLAYNCMVGHLPPLGETELWIRSLRIIRETP